MHCMRYTLPLSRLHDCTDALYKFACARHQTVQKFLIGSAPLDMRVQKQQRLTRLLTWVSAAGMCLCPRWTRRTACCSRRYPSPVSTDAWPDTGEAFSPLSCTASCSHSACCC